jgi:hypothetical protein
VDEEEPTLVRVSVDASAPGERSLEVVACRPDGQVPRLRNAWRALRGHYPWWAFAVSSGSAAAALADALGAPVASPGGGGSAATLVDVGCSDGCAIRVRAHEPSAEGEPGWVSVAYLSTHVALMHAGAWARVRHAWSALRGDYGWTGWDLLPAGELGSALAQAAGVAFPAAAVGGAS